MRIRLVNPEECHPDGWPSAKGFEMEYICDSYEIIEEDKKIEKIGDNWTYPEIMVIINELVDAVNKLMEK